MQCSVPTLTRKELLKRVSGFVDGVGPFVFLMKSSIFYEYSHVEEGGILSKREERERKAVEKIEDDYERPVSLLMMLGQ